MKLGDIIDTIEERVVTFGKQAFPKNGQIVVMAGGPDSGKGYVLGNIIPIHGKVFNSDDWLEMIAKQGGVDLSDSEAIKDIYASVKPQHEKFVKQFLNNLNDKNKPNIIIDGTGGGISRNIAPLIPFFKRMGYETTLVYVYTLDRDVAWKRNLSRQRVVAKDVFDAIHDKVESIVKSSLSKFDHVWYVDSSMTTKNWWITNPEQIVKVK